MAGAGHAQYTGALLAEGGAALQRGDWAAARALFADAVEREDTPEARYGLARALEWAGEFAAAVTELRVAFAGYRARGEVRLPALIAGRELAFLHAAVYGNGAAAGGWLARSRSLVEESGDCPERGWVELAEALATDDPDEITAHAEAAAAVAGSFGDVDLRFCAMAYQGTSDVLRGRVDEGMRLVDEAALAATAGEVRDHLVVGEIYCKLLLCCESALDVRRAQEWITVADAAGRASHDLWVSAICRMYYGGILTAAGRWQEAEDELCAALRIYDDGMRALRSGAAVRLADLRVRQGRIEEAERLLADNEFDGQAALPLARLHLIRGEVDLAAAVLRRSLGSASDGAARTCPRAPRGGPGRTPPCRSPAGARPAGELWRRRADCGTCVHWRNGSRVCCAGSTGWPISRPLSGCSLTRGCRGRPPGPGCRSPSCSPARSRRWRWPRDGRRWRSSGHWAPGGTPTRPPTCCAAWGPGPARSPGRAACSPDGSARCFGLLVEGLANQQIAERLFLSKRTVEHHVGAILAKTGTGTRAEALAHAVQHGVQ